MEWLLQVVDEIDDAVSAVRLFTIGWGEEIGLVVAGTAAACALYAAVLRSVA